MLAGIVGAAPGDDAELVAVALHIVQLVVGHVAGRTRGGWPLGQATVAWLRRQLAQRAGATGMRPEGPTRQRRSLVIEFDTAVFAAVDQLADVAIADRRSVRRAASGHLLLGAFDDLVHQIARVGLGDRAHDALQ